MSVASYQGVEMGVIPERGERHAPGVGLRNLIEIAISELERTLKRLDGRSCQVILLGR